LELRKRKDVAKLAFNDVGPMGLVGDVNTGLVRDAARNDALCTSYLRESPQRDLKVDLRGNLAVLPRPKSLGAR